jgi:hypothetical protein
MYMSVQNFVEIMFFFSVVRLCIITEFYAVFTLFYLSAVFYTLYLNLNFESHFHICSYTEGHCISMTISYHNMSFPLAKVNCPDATMYAHQIY